MDPDAGLKGRGDVGAQIMTRPPKPPPFDADEYQATTQTRRPVDDEPTADLPKPPPLRIPPGWHNATAEALGRTFGIVGVKAPRRKQRHH